MLKKTIMFAVVAGLAFALAPAAQAQQTLPIDLLNPSFETHLDVDIGGTIYNTALEVADVRADGTLDGHLLNADQPTGPKPNLWDFSGAGGDVGTDARWPDWWHYRSAGPTDGLQVAFMADRGENNDEQISQIVGSVNSLAIGSYQELTLTWDARFGNASGGEASEEVDTVFTAFIEEDGVGEIASWSSNLGSLAEGRLIPTGPELAIPLPPAQKLDPGAPVSIGPQNMEQFSLSVPISAISDPDADIIIGFKQVDDGTAGGSFYNTRTFMDNVALAAITTAVPGDVDGDGDVDLNDVGFFEARFGQSGLPLPPGTNSADLDADGDVDLHDLTILRDNYGAGVGAAPAAAPEPGSAALLVLGLGAVIRRRKR